MSWAFDPTLTGGMEAGWQARLNTVEMPPNPMSGQPALERIELQVWWTAGGQRRSLTLDAHRTRILKPGDL
jgi:hypothetical protein